MKIFFLLIIFTFQFGFALKDLEPHPQKSNTYNEFWTYHFFLENDMNVYLNYSRANVGSFKDPVCGADLVVQNFKGKNYNMAREKPKSAFKYNASTYKLEVHPNIWFQGNPKEKQRVFFNTSKKGINYLVDLELTEIELGPNNPNSIQKLKGETVGLFIHIPKAKVSGIIAINNDTLRVNGTAYMDHTFQTDVGPKIAKRGTRFINHSSDGYDVGYILFINKKNKYLGYSLNSTNDKVVTRDVAKVEGIKTKKTNGAKSFIQNMNVSFSDGSQKAIAFHKPTHKLSVLDEFGYFTKKVVKTFMGGEVIHFRGKGTSGSTPIYYNNFFTK